MASPIVPPRPTRASAGPTEVRDSLPQVPPRPARKLDPSPAREEYSRSPLNELPPSLNNNNAMRRSSRSSLAPTDVLPRPPSVSLPSIGQEGSEYSSYDQLPPEAHGISVGENGLAAPQQTRNVAANIPLHAPKASVPQSTAKRNIEAVTGTDSTQAAAAGIGRAQPEDDVHRVPVETHAPLGRVPSRSDYHYQLTRVSSTEPHSLEQRAHPNRSTSSLPVGASKASSIHEDEHGIPEIGVQIPLYRNAGDVQAPSHGSAMSQHAPGIGFFNDGSARNHHRKRSSRHEFGPPGSYGLHGHGQEPQDQFERSWAAKHPKEAAMEGYSAYGHFHSPRSMTALSTEQLNKLVNQGSDNGMGTKSTAVGTPSWEIANQATEEYLTRYSPRPPSSTADRKKRGSSGSQPAVESPLRRARTTDQQEVIVRDDGTIHINEPERNLSHVTGGGPADGAIDLGPKSGNTSDKGGWFDERGDGTPILASDETLKRPGSAFMHAAVSPELRPSDDYYDSDHGNDGRRSSWHATSRPSSRPGSVHGSSYHGGNLHRFISHEDHHGSGVHTPLEEIEEYEPLFPDEEDGGKLKPKSKAVPKRPGLEHHHFPSQDIWEDTPSSLQYQTTVETPDLPHEEKMLAMSPPKAGSRAFETPEQEQQRRNLNPDTMLSDAKMVSKPRFKGAVQDELERPGVRRFPSSDVWEDTPDSMRLVTTVSGPQMEELKSPPDDDGYVEDDDEDEGPRGERPIATKQPRPSIPLRPQRRSRLAEEVTPETVDTSSQQCDLQSSEPSYTKPSSRPIVPDRPKPAVPARPARPSASAAAPASNNDHNPLLEAAVAGAAGVGAAGATAAAATTSTKVPPAIPARPSGATSDKFTALKSGFMNDLNNRLKLGPQQPAPKAKEEDVAAAAAQEQEPLADARKSRARGPPRRRPAASASAAAAEEKEKDNGQTLGFSSLVTVWEIPGLDDNDEEDEAQSAKSRLRVPDSAPATATTAPVDDEVQSETAPPLASPQGEVRKGLQSALVANEAQNTAEPGPAQPVASPPLDGEAMVAAEGKAEARIESQAEVETNITQGVEAHPGTVEAAAEAAEE